MSAISEPTPTPTQPLAETPRPVASATAPVGLATPTPVVSAEGVSPAGIRADAAAHREISLPAPDAAAVVREVAELTHEVRLRGRSSVEVTFNFKDDTELAVRLAYRDGDVHTTFRTDSAELRTALGREWQSYAGNVAQEFRGNRVPEAVFTSSTDAAGSASSRDAGSSAGGDARQQSHSSQTDHPGAHRPAARAGRFGGESAATSAPLPNIGPLVPTDRLLNVFA